VSHFPLSKGYRRNHPGMHYRFPMISRATLASFFSDQGDSKPVSVDTILYVFYRKVNRAFSVGRIRTSKAKGQLKIGGSV
jgi:hypothetical protein